MVPGGSETLLVIIEGVRIKLGQTRIFLEGLEYFGRKTSKVVTSQIFPNFGIKKIKLSDLFVLIENSQGIKSF
jgi:hypothetical protein